jgi:hypothetical protein
VIRLDHAHSDACGGDNIFHYCNTCEPVNLQSCPSQTTYLIEQQIFIAETYIRKDTHKKCWERFI